MSKDNSDSRTQQYRQAFEVNSATLDGIAAVLDVALQEHVVNEDVVRTVCASLRKLSLANRVMLRDTKQPGDQPLLNADIVKEHISQELRDLEKTRLKRQDDENL